MTTAFLTVAVTLLTSGADPAPSPDVVAQTTLRDAGLPTDGPGLLGLFRARTPTDADRARLAGLVKQLGDESFEVREKASKELLLAGRAAMQ
jgi:hypothetical protein